MKICPNVHSTNDVAAPRSAKIHIQKMAPAPPMMMADVTPVMFPTPTRAPIPTQNAWNEEIILFLSLLPFSMLDMGLMYFT